MEKLKKQFVFMMLVVMALQLVTVRVSTVYAATAGDVVINEVAWAGTADSSNDEWLELFNTTSQSIDLTGWYIEDDYGAGIYTIESGEIPARGYFLIEDSDVAVSNVAADAVIGLSFANSGDSLVLKNSSGLIIDSVNSSGGDWYAGDSDSNSTMERIDPNVSADTADNWASALSGNGATGSSGSDILGTPKGPNSNYGGSGAEVALNASDSNPSSGESISVSADLTGGSEVFAYGFELIYDPAILSFSGSSEGDFLNSDGEDTAFYAALENGNEGTLLIGNARLTDPETGVDGDGQLFVLNFDVVGVNGDSTTISFAGSSFLSDPIGDVPVQFTGAPVIVEDISTVEPITNLQVVEGTERYSLELSWDAPASGADSYLIQKQLADGSYAVLGEIATTSFVDDDSVPNGGNLVPNVNYTYQVIAVKNNTQSSAVQTVGVETRGITGDNNRSDRVDGRDIERLARSFGSLFGETDYDPLNDTTFDAVIDGSDLIDIGANFGLTY